MTLPTNHVLVIRDHVPHPDEEDHIEWDAWVECMDPKRRRCDLWMVCDECRAAGVRRLDLHGAPTDPEGFPILHGERHGYSDDGFPLYSWRCTSTADDLAEYVMNELPPRLGIGRWYVTITYDGEGGLVLNVLGPVPAEAHPTVG